MPHFLVGFRDSSIRVLIKPIFVRQSKMKSPSAKGGSSSTLENHYQTSLTSRHSRCSRTAPSTTGRHDILNGPTLQPGNSGSPVKNRHVPIWICVCKWKCVVSTSLRSRIRSQPVSIDPVWTALGQNFCGTSIVNSCE